MDLQNLKEIINKAGFGEEALRLMNEVLDEAISKNALSPEGKEKLLGIVDTEIELADIEADALEEVALALEAFASETEKAEELEGEEMDAAEEAMEFDNKQEEESTPAAPQQ